MSKECQNRPDRAPCSLCGAVMVAQTMCSDPRCVLSPCQLCGGEMRLEIFRPPGGAQALLVLCDVCGAEWKPSERSSGHRTPAIDTDTQAQEVDDLPF